MRRLALAFSLALFVLLAGVATSGCKDIQRLLPAKTIEDPDKDSPEYVVQQIIKAAMNDDFEVAWKQFRPWLHSQQLQTHASELNWKQFNFNAMHRNVKRLYLEGPTKPIFKVDYTEEIKDDQEIKVFVVNMASDMPTPVLLTRDPAANNEWRVRQCSLGL